MKMAVSKEYMKRLKKELRRYSMSAGMADHYKACTFAALKALGIPVDKDVAPIDITNAINALKVKP